VVPSMSGHAWSDRSLLDYGFLRLSERALGGFGDSRVFKHGPDFSGCYFPSKSSVLRARRSPPGNGSLGIERTLSQRRSSCLLFQIVGVETYLLLPDDQRDRGNLPCQSQSCHRGLPSLGEQILVEIVKRSTTAANSGCCTLENIFEIVVVILI